MTVSSTRRLGPDDAALPAVLSLIVTSFAYMEGRIEPPSAALEMTLDDLARCAAEGELWAVEEGGRVVACVTLAEKGGVLSLGNLAVAVSHRGRGLARQLVDLAAASARDRGLSAVELQAHLELTETLSAFAAMGFHVTGDTDPDFDHPAPVTFAKPA